MWDKGRWVQRTGELRAMGESIADAVWVRNGPCAITWNPAGLGTEDTQGPAASPFLPVACWNPHSPSSSVRNMVVYICQYLVHPFPKRKFNRQFDIHVK